MTTLRRTRIQYSLALLALAGVAAVVLVTHLQLSFDLSAFLPDDASFRNEILIEQMRNGPGSRVLVIGLAGSDPTELAEASDQLRRSLEQDRNFASVSNGEFGDGNSALPEPVASYYLLQQDVDYSRASLEAAVQARLMDLAFGAGSELSALIARDPFLVTLDILERLVPVSLGGKLWFAADGSAVLVAETRAPPTDIAAQQQAIAAIRDAFGRLPASDGLALDITGVGAFSIELQNTIRHEATIRSIYASVALVLVLLLFFRRPRFVLLAAVPIAMGFITGLALIALLFDNVHGITLACGFTLLGVAVDYPLHLFSHTRIDDGRGAVRRIWPTLRLGVISTAVVYVGLAFSGSAGLAQLGLFTATGVIVALLVTRFWVALFLPAGEGAHDDSAPIAARLSFTASLLALLIAFVPLLLSWQEGLWDDQLSSLSPVDGERLASDRNLRSATGAVDLRYQGVITADTLEELLLADEAANVRLTAMTSEGLLDGWQSVSQLLPSKASQERRQAAIHPLQLQSELGTVVEGSAFRNDAFAPFVDAARKAKALPPLTPERLADTAFATWLGAHLLRIGSKWVSLIHLRNPQPEAIAKQMAGWDGDAELVDLSAASRGLMRDYRLAAGQTIALAALVVIALLWRAQRRARTLLWIVLTVVAALAATVTIVNHLQGGLTVMHLVSLLLVLGLGLDYALFLARDEPAPERAASRRGVFACAASTTVAFGILAGSSIPVLQFLGLTVAVGSACSFLLAWLGSQY